MKRNRSQSREEPILYTAVCTLGCCTTYTFSSLYPAYYPAARWVNNAEARREENRAIDQLIRLYGSDP